MSSLSLSASELSPRNSSVIPQLTKISCIAETSIPHVYVDEEGNNGGGGDNVDDENDNVDYDYAFGYNKDDKYM